MGHPVFAFFYLSSRKISSIVLAEDACDLEGQGRDGSYLPVSIALTLWRETSSFSASSCWDHPSSARNAFSRLFIFRCPVQSDTG